MNDPEAGDFAADDGTMAEDRLKRVNFRSDNEAPAAPTVLAALADANAGSAYAYGDDAWSGRLDEAFGKLFDTSLRVYPVATGTAANALAVAQLCPPYGAVYCHGNAHLNTDECGAPEFFSAGAKLVTVPGAAAKIDPAALSEILSHAGTLGVHECRPSALSLTQATEHGTVYSVEEVASLVSLAKARGLRVHMDGARFANALAHLGCAPADVTWRAGVDMLSFGATKNGAVMAEALVVFDDSLVDGLERRRKRAAHLLSKQRYVAAQLLACVEGGLWLELAGRANAAAARIASGIQGADDIELVYPVQANEVFVRLATQANERLQAAGFEYHPWPGLQDVYRLVMPWCVDDEDVTRFIAVAAGG